MDKEAKKRKPPKDRFDQWDWSYNLQDHPEETDLIGTFIVGSIGFMLIMACLYLMTEGIIHLVICKKL